MDQVRDEADGPDGGSDRALAVYALGDDFAFEEAMRLAGVVSVAATIAAYETSLVPLKAVEPKLDGAAGKALDDALKPIGAKIAPHLSTDQARRWRVAVMMALSDLSPRTAIRATREAMHVPMQFLSETETAIRTKAAEIHGRHARALWRLRRLQAEIDAAAQPKLAAPAGWEGGQVAALTPEEIRRTPKWVLRMGISGGHISADDVAAAGVDMADGEITAEAA